MLPTDPVPSTHQSGIPRGVHRNPSGQRRPNAFSIWHVYADATFQKDSLFLIIHIFTHHYFFSVIIMYTSEINKILQRNPTTAPTYVGCFPSDRIPSDRGSYPYCMVINTDRCKLPGTHWLAMYVLSSVECDYYDSLAEWPPRSPHIADYLGRFKTVNRVRHRIQSRMSMSCGKHAIYFLHRRCQGWPLRRIVRHLANCQSGADRLVSGFVRKCIFGEGGGGDFPI